MEREKHSGNFICAENEIGQWRKYTNWSNKATGGGPNAHNGCNNMSFDFPRYTPTSLISYWTTFPSQAHVSHHQISKLVCQFCMQFSQFAFVDLNFDVVVEPALHFPLWFLSCSLLSYFWQIQITWGCKTKEQKKEKLEAAKNTFRANNCWYIFVGIFGDYCDIFRIWNLLNLKKMIFRVERCGGGERLIRNDAKERRSWN